ncbi:MAG: type IV pilus twitching motility protein PilT [Firmicutes bacterium]|nr:type IV pilus twitching motility protein PilT [Bacillota bacterium]MCL5038956.1 type IV pilus twitching motility protein PilT [Bacillota bacterium]
MDLQQLLREAVLKKASDLHLTVQSPPVLRINGELTRWGTSPLNAADTEGILLQILTEEQKRRFEAQGDLDFSYSLPGQGRFRVNAYRQRGTVALALRVIPYQVITLEELGFPPVVASLARQERGLVLVTGPTGSGKSTTLAAMIDLINSEQSCHIITLEDPIEYLHRHKLSVINQREIGSDTQSFALALRSALRQDPDVILIGEMRDLETISIALTAAETGHLVLATLHTTDAPQTVDRVVDVFPPHQQQQIRVQFAAVLQGILAQQLLPRADRPGRVAALEILVATPAVRNLIREGKTHQLSSALQTGAKYGMQTMESSLRVLAERGLISPEELKNRLIGLAGAGGNLGFYQG